MYAHGMRLKDLEAIAKSPRNGGEDTVQAYYGWRETRAMTVAKGFGAAALSLLSAWLIPFLKHEYKGASPALMLVAPVALLATLAVVGLLSLRRMDRIHSSFVQAMVWLQRLR